jgi:NADH-quinone oxidoreductase subunit N
VTPPSPALDWRRSLPALIVLLGGFLAVGVDLFRGHETGGRAATSRCCRSRACSAPAGSSSTACSCRHAGRSRAFDGALVLDDLARFLSLADPVGGTALVLVAPTWTPGAAHRHRRVLRPCCSPSTASMCWLVSANDCPDRRSSRSRCCPLSLYVLTGVTRKNPRSNEAAVKYLVTGAFATCFLLDGHRASYTARRAPMTFEGIGASLASGNSSPLLLSGLGMLLVGFGFKIGAAPFHMWVADVYEGAPTTTTAYMSVTVKAAGVGALARVLLTVGLGSRPDLWARSPVVGAP